jgi:hypothetical protein
MIPLCKAKSLEGKRVEGYAFEIESKAYILKPPVAFDYDHDPLVQKITEDNYVEVHPSTVCLFTGKTDKNGVKIWEKDKIYALANGVTYTVEYGPYINTEIDHDGDKPDDFGWYLERETENYDPPYGESLVESEKWLEVIGHDKEGER